MGLVETGGVRQGCACGTLGTGLANLGKAEHNFGTAGGGNILGPPGGWGEGTGKWI